MKKFLTILIILMGYAFAKANTSSTTVLQKFTSHRVASGETLSTIAKTYGLEEREITKLNPDVKEDIYEGLVIILPTSKIAKASAQEQDNLKFITHKVKRKEGLYGISKKYNVPQDIIKKYNTQLYSQVLRKGDKIRIPINYKQSRPQIEDNTQVVSLPENSSGTKIHKVIAKETKYGIARKYGVTIDELETTNPAIKDGLKEGTIITVPQRNYAESAIIDEKKYAFYEVKKGNTIYSLLRLLKIEADELVELNPALEDGLKEGMILKVPKGTSGSLNPSNNAGLTIDPNTQLSIDTSKKGSLLDSVTNYSTKRIAIMMPFGLKRMASDSAKVNEKLLKTDRVLRISLDMYSGMLQAVEDAKKAGLNIIVDTYDTDYNRADGASTNARKVEDIIRNNNFSDTKAVIGPLLGGNIDRVSSLLNSSRVPVLSPVSDKVEARSNVFVTRPSEEILQHKIVAFLKTNAFEKNIIIIADSKNSAAKSKLKALFPNAKEVAPRSGDDGYYLYPGDIPAKLDAEKENWVLLETNDVPLISNVTTSLNAELATKKIMLFTTNKGSAYDSDEIQHMHLSNLTFHFPSVDREYKYGLQKQFIDDYESRTGITPNSYAIRGYDLMYDTILRLSYANDLYTAAMSGIETEYVENKFRYENSYDGGFKNNAVYIMKYTKDLTLEEVPAIEEVLFTIDKE